VLAVEPRAGIKIVCSRQMRFPRVRIFADLHDEARSRMSSASSKLERRLAAVMEAIEALKEGW
jgi:ABC-type phosphate transport system auxiliary subunit